MSDFLDQFEGMGFENFDGTTTTQPALKVSQALTPAVSDGTIPVGHFYNSATMVDYGTSINCVCVYYDQIWIERDKTTEDFVKYHSPLSIPVIRDGYNMTTESGNPIDVQWRFFVILPEHKEDGLLVYRSTPGNMKHLKHWMTQMRIARLDSGKPMPIFGCVWKLELGKETNKKGQAFFTFSRDGKSYCERVGVVGEELYNSSIKEAREVAEAFSKTYDSQNALEAPTANNALPDLS